MTSRHPKPRHFNARRASLALAPTALLVFLSQAQASSDTWSSTPANGTWATATNWVGGVSPGATSGTTNTDVATFLTSSVVAITVDSGRNIGGITFNGTSGTYTLTGGPLLVSNGGTIQTTSNSQSQNINTPIQIQGENATYTFTANTPGTNRVTTFGGAISGTSTTGNTSVLTLNGSSAPASGNPLNGVISDGAGGGKLALVKDGAGTWSLATGNTFSGGLTVNQGTLRTGNSGNSNAIFGTGTVTLNGGTLLTGSTTAITINNALSIGASGGTLAFRGGGTFSPTSIGGSGVMTLTPSSANTVTVTPTSFQNFTGTIRTVGNTPSGAGAIFLRLGSAYVQSSGQNAALDLGVNTQLNQQAGTNTTVTTTFGSLSGVSGASLGGSAAGSGTFVYSIGGRNENTSYAGVIVDGSSKTGFTKTGTGIQTLSGTNTYTGGTTVTDGTLLGASASAFGTGDVTISGGTLSSNISSVSGVGAFTMSTGGLDLNSTSVGALSLAANKNFSMSGGTWSVSFASTSSYDQVQGSGTGIFSVSGGTLSLGTVPDYTASYTLLSGFSSGSVGALSITGYDTVNYIASLSNAGVLSFASAVPEPSTWAALAGLAGLGFAASRRRRKA